MSSAWVVVLSTCVSLHAADTQKFAVPETDDPAVLLNFIETTEKLPVPRTSREAAMDFVRDSRTAMLTAAEKILTLKPDDETRDVALQAKLQALSYLAQIPSPPDTAALDKFAAELREMKQDALAERAEIFSLSVLASGLGRVDNEQRIGLLDRIKAALAAGPKDRQHAGVAFQTAQMLEQIGDTALAAKAFAEFAESFAKSDDKDIARVAEQMAGAGRRLGLMGTAFTQFSGKSLAGPEFNLSQFKNKVVLVDFWATWCGPCVAELPNVKAAYRQYHDKGFEVVGISLDDDRAALEKFVAENSIPWPNILSTDTQPAGSDVTLPDYYGVMAIPTVILIGKDGKVVSLNARGEALQRQLAALLGDQPE
jgi:thiol-disulfide isomerase/thioredoxin